MSVSASARRARTLRTAARLAVIGAVLLAVAGGCGEGGRGGGGRAPSRVVLICVDGMDWTLAGPLMDQGRMPNLERIVKDGVRADLRSVARDEKVRSVWICIAAGRVVRVSEELPPDAPDGTRLPGAAVWGAPPVWDILGAHGKTVGVVNWPATLPASRVNGWLIASSVTLAPEDGMPEIADLTWPPELAGELGPLRKATTATTDDEIRRFMNGDAWTSAEHPDLVQRATDFRFEWAKDQTVLQVASHFLDTRGQPDFLAVWFGGLLQNLHPFWGPMFPGTTGVTDSEEVVSTFKDLVPRYYERVDGLIGDILAKTDPASTVIVCSGFGFRGPRRDPQGFVRLGAVMHSEIGLLAASGPGVAAVGELPDASVLDIAPTVLALLGVPVPRDMGGYVVREMLDPAFLESHPVTYTDAAREPEESR